MKHIVGFLFLFLQVSITVFAGKETFVGPNLTGTDISINSIVSVSDQYFGLTSTSTVVKSYAQIEFGIDINKLTLQSTGLGPAAFKNISADLQLELSFYDKTGFLIGGAPLTKTLSLSFASGTNTSILQSFATQENAYKVEAKILSNPVIKFDGVVQATVPTYFYLKPTVILERYYPFSYNIKPYTTGGLGKKIHINKEIPELEVYWAQLDGAEDYELEYTYIDNYPNAVSLPLNYDFKNNSTRVILQGNNYRFPLLFDKGYVLFRVRGIGRTGVNFDQSLSGVWSAEDAGLISSFNVDHKYEITEANVPTTLTSSNWQYNVVFAEEGKRKEHIAYYDGSLHSRQELTYNNSTNEYITSETVYDYLGRPAVKIIPVPLSPDYADQSFKYKYGLHKNVAQLPYSKADFDLDYSTTCDVATAPMDSSSGASQYFSSSNVLKTDENAYIPKAQGYPFVQTEFVGDNTGRVKRQSGVGKDHKLGSDHETKYYYVTPTQEELNALFGNDVGYNSHYQKKVVVDPNGQASITYTDLAGKVIATALAGNSASNVDELPDQAVAKNVTSTILRKTSPYPSVQNNNVLDATNHSLTITQNFTVLLDNSDYTVNYSLTPAYVNDLKCYVSPTALPCVDCDYLLDIYIENECGIRTSIESNTKISSAAVACSTVVDHDKTQTVTLSSGSYTLYKRLKIDPVAYLAKESQALIDFQTTCAADIPTLGSLYDAMQPDCTPVDACAVCQDALNKSIDQLKSENPTVEFSPAMIAEQRERCLDLCKVPTTCDASYKLMLQDFYLEGQYGVTDNTKAKDWVLSIFNVNNVLIRNKSNDEGSYKKPTLDTKSLNATVLTEIAANVALLPQSFISDAVTTSGGKTYYNLYFNSDNSVALVPVRIVPIAGEEADLDINDATKYTTIPESEPNTPAMKVYYDQYGRIMPWDAVASPDFFFYGILPQKLLKLDDFIPYYNESFARSLITSHPEYNYYEFCTDNFEATSTFTGSGSPATYSSEEFDYYLKMSVTNDIRSNGDFLPIELNGLIDNTKLYNSTNFDDLSKIDPYYNSLTAAEKLLFIAGLTNFNGSGITVKQFISMTNTCGSRFHASEADMKSNSCIGNFMQSSDNQLKKDDWNAYVNYYLSEKFKFQKVQYFFNAAVKASFDGGCNECIGNKSYIPAYTTIRVRKKGWKGWFGSKQNKTVAIDNPHQPCSWGTYSHYKDKAPRFIFNMNKPTSGGGSDCEMDSQDPIYLNQATNLALFQTTGQYTVMRNMTPVLSYLMKSGEIAPASNTHIFSASPREGLTSSFYDRIVYNSPDIQYGVTGWLGMKWVKTSNTNNSVEGYFSKLLTTSIEEDDAKIKNKIKLSIPSKTYKLKWGNGTLHYFFEIPFNISGTQSINGLEEIEYLKAQINAANDQPDLTKIATASFDWKYESLSNPNYLYTESGVNYFTVDATATLQMTVAGVTSNIKTGVELLLYGETSLPIDGSDEDLSKVCLPSKEINALKTFISRLAVDNNINQSPSTTFTFVTDQTPISPQVDYTNEFDVLLRKYAFTTVGNSKSWSGTSTVSNGGNTVNVDIVPVGGLVTDKLSINITTNGQNLGYTLPNGNILTFDDLEALECIKILGDGSFTAQGMFINSNADGTNVSDPIQISLLITVTPAGGKIFKSQECGPGKALACTDLGNSNRIFLQNMLISLGNGLSTTPQTYVIGNNLSLMSFDDFNGDISNQLSSINTSNNLQYADNLYFELIDQTTQNVKADFTVGAYDVVSNPADKSLNLVLQPKDVNFNWSKLVTLSNLLPDFSKREKSGKTYWFTVQATYIDPNQIGNNTHTTLISGYSPLELAMCEDPTIVTSCTFGKKNIARNGTFTNIDINALSRTWGIEYGDDGYPIKFDFSKKELNSALPADIDANYNRDNGYSQYAWLTNSLFPAFSHYRWIPKQTYPSLNNADILKYYKYANDQIKNFKEHTGDNGYYLMYDGSNGEKPNYKRERAWYQTVAVQKDKRYSFEAYFANPSSFGCDEALPTTINFDYSYYSYLLPGGALTRTVLKIKFEDNFKNLLIKEIKINGVNAYYSSELAGYVYEYPTSLICGTLFTVSLATEATVGEAPTTFTINKGCALTAYKTQGSNGPGQIIVGAAARLDINGLNNWCGAPTPNNPSVSLYVDTRLDGVRKDLNVDANGGGVSFPAPYDKTSLTTLATLEGVKLNYLNGWVKVTGTWIATESDSVSIGIAINSAYGFGNNIAIDDIAFYEYCDPEFPPQVDKDDVTVSDEDDCKDFYNSMASFNLYLTKRRIIDQFVNDFKTTYVKKCLGAKESLKLTYPDKQHHFTLYYYDQAGNLTKTIPPAGVHMITGTDDTDLENKNNAINNDRDAGKYVLSKQPLHDMATNYRYNSLNQLVSESLPDHETFKVWEVNATSNTGIPGDFSLNAMDFADDKNGVTLASIGTYSGFSQLYLTNDGGNTWTSPSKLGNETINGFNALPDGSSIFAVGDNGLFAKSVDNGAVWVNYTFPYANVDLKAAYFISDYEGIVIDKNGSIYATNNSYDYSNWLKLFNGQSTFGSSFEITEIKKLAGSYDFLVVATHNNDKNLYKLNFDGTAWSYTLLGITPSNYTKILSSSSGQYYVDASGTIYLISGSQLIPMAGLPDKTITSIGQKHAIAGNTLYVLPEDDGGVYQAKVLGANKTPAIIAGNYVITTDGSWFDLSYNTGNNYTTPIATNIQVVVANSKTGFAYTSTYKFIAPSAGVLINVTNNPNIQSAKKLVTNAAYSQICILDAVGNVHAFYANGAAYTYNNIIAGLTNITDIDIVGTDLYAISNNTLLKYSLSGNTWTSQGSVPVVLPLNTIAMEVNEFESGLNLLTSNGKSAELNLNTNTLTNNLTITLDKTAISDYKSNKAYVTTTTQGIYLGYDLTASTLEIKNTGRGELYTDVSSSAGNLLFSTDEKIVRLNTNATVDVSANLISGTVVKDIMTLSNGNSIVATNKGLLELSANLSITTKYNTNEINSLIETGNKVFAGGSSSIIASSPVAVSYSWTNNTAIASMRLIQVTYAPNNTDIYAVGGNGTIVYSNDAGLTWNRFPTTLSTVTLNNILFANANEAVITGTNGKVYILNISANTFGELNLGASNPGATIKDIDINGKTLALYATNGKVVWSENIDQTTWVWNTMNVPVYTINAISLSNEKTLYLAGNAGRLIRVHLATGTDGYADLLTKGYYQEPWVAEHLRDIKFVDYNTGYAVGDNGVVLKTVNRGNSWIVKTDAANTDITYGPISTAANGQVFIGGYSQSQVFTVYKLNDLSEKISKRYWYDDAGRIIASQNSKQYKRSTKAYSYTVYDQLGRVIESGEVATNAAIQTATTLSSGQTLSDFENWLKTGKRAEITRMYYSTPKFTPAVNNFTQDNLITRVATVIYKHGEITTLAPSEAYLAQKDGDYYHAMHYTYDIHGNVKSLLTEDSLMAKLTLHRYKRIDYDYDLIAGKVNRVWFQKAKEDQFIHTYEYDAENRITQVFTGTTEYNLQKDARYGYYRHGPLARTEIGQDHVQGMDYAYTIQGWIKAVNSASLLATNDIGKDGLSPTNGTFAQDEAGFVLGYYKNDFGAIGSTVGDPKTTNTTGNLSALYTGTTPDIRSLYNGNISSMQTAIAQFMRDGNGVYNSTTSNDNNLLSSYTYDQLNRLAKVQKFNQMQSAPSSIKKYYETFGYDANGNITKVVRYGADENNVMDFLSYHYQNIKQGYSSNTNKLSYVTDAVGKTTTTDVNDQAVDNYSYDEIGNLIADKEEQIAKIDWTVSGKIKKITREANSLKPALEFYYDASGNRTAKKVTQPHAGGTSTVTYTFYVKDASGNTMSNYSYELAANVLNQTEVPIYGSSRIGVLNVAKILSPTDKVLPAVTAYDPTNTNHILLNGSNNITVTAGKTAFVQANANYTGTLVLNYGAKLIILGTASPTSFQDYGSTITNNGILTLPELATINYNTVFTNNNILTINNTNLVQDIGKIFNNGTLTIKGNVQVNYGAQFNNTGIATIGGNATVYGVMSNTGTGTIKIAQLLTIAGGGNLNIGAGATVTTNNYQAYGIVNALGVGAGLSVTGNMNALSGSKFTGALNVCVKGTKVVDNTGIAATVNFNGCDAINTGIPGLNLYARILGKKQYELNNHLGNVLVTISDKKTPYLGAYRADVISYTDYTAFGANLDGRNGGSYRYGFNGKENDPETGTQDYGFRIYNPGLGRFLSVDPLTPKFAELTPYQFASNTPIAASDLDGLEACGRTTILYTESGAQGGLGYGGKVGIQGGTAYDMIGKTEFIASLNMQNAFGPNALTAEMVSPSIFAGGDINIFSGGFETVNRPTFAHAVGVSVAQVSVGPLDFTFGDSYGIQGGLSLGLKFLKGKLGAGNTSSVRRSISLTYEQTDLLKEFANKMGVANRDWKLSETYTDIFDENGKPISREREVGYMDYSRGEFIGSGIKVNSQVFQNDEGQYYPSGLYESSEYTEAAATYMEEEYFK